MTEADFKADLLGYLQTAREALVWKLEGLDEYDVRRPLTPTGTNLLGLVKHVASVDAEYLGLVFGRPFPDPLPWFTDDAEVNADMWATPDESREQILELYRRAWAHGDATVASRPLDSVGSVPWWPLERRQVTLHKILVHLTTETYRHAGHADIVREQIDGAAGFRPGGSNLATEEPAWWREYHDRVEQAARAAAGRA